MSKQSRFAALLLVLPLALAPLACGGDENDRAALQSDELDRDLDLALNGDSVPTTFEDTAIAPPAAAEPAPEPETPPRTQPPPRPKPKPQPPIRSEPAPPPEPAPAPAPRTVTRSVPVGTMMSLTLNETLSTETNHAGDGFTATLSEPVLDADGDVVLPAGALVHGRVTQVQKSGHVGETAVINLAFESVSFEGESYPLEASVVSANPERKSRPSTVEQVGKAAAGAAAGAVLGKILGKSTSSTIKGAVIGAAAGTAIAMGTADVDAVLKAGSAMTIRTDAPVRVTTTTSG